MGDGCHQIGFEFIETEQPGDVLKHDGRACDTAVFAIDGRRPRT